MAKIPDLYNEAIRSLASGSNCLTVDDENDYPTTRSYEGSLTCVNEYAGFQPPPGVTVVTERVPVSEITPEQFFSDYVRYRKPVAIAGHLKDYEWAGHRWTNAYLRAKAGKAKVLVEKRPEYSGATGLGAFGPKSDMEYGKFLNEIECGHEGF